MNNLEIIYPKKIKKLYFKIFNPLLTDMLTKLNRIDYNITSIKINKLFSNIIRFAINNNAKYSYHYNTLDGKIVKHISNRLSIYEDDLCKKYNSSIIQYQNKNNYFDSTDFEFIYNKKIIFKCFLEDLLESIIDIEDIYFQDVYIIYDNGDVGFPRCNLGQNVIEFEYPEVILNEQFQRFERKYLIKNLNL